MTEEMEYTDHKGLIDVSDTVVFILGFVVMAIGFLISVVGVDGSSQVFVGAGIALIWLGVIIAFFSGVIGNRKIPAGYEKR
jgi:heme A synthase